ncbi:tryptophan 7-halogenase [Maricaulis sp.]|uniref:tryptophan 7-halogenase n=1 Tax=Maricaulis sp. TaxID=1486257 RepID=UPI002633943B|nr:tryptophan 7-halogenase [Maricaulis sp.]
MSLNRKTIVVCGGGLDGNFVALSLAKTLGADFRIVQIAGSERRADNVFYGSATSPEGYNFLHALGLDERTLLLKSQTAFSYGSFFRRWASPQPWILCHHAPFPILAGIPLRHFLTRSGAPLEPLLISARAAALGRFAHPPDDPRNPLSRAEYGYQFSPDEWIELLDSLVANSRVERVRADITGIDHQGDTVSAVQVAGRERVSGDIFVDASGPARHCIGALASNYRATRNVAACAERQDVPQLGPPCRVIEAGPSGWTSTTHLQDSILKIRIDAADDNDLPATAIQMALGQLDEAWIGNCIAVGHAAWAIEPLTPAPMMLLQRDIVRLQELVPGSDDMTTERREFNRRFKDDLAHANSFHDALYIPETRPEAVPRRPLSPGTGSEALSRKIAQFKNRGILVSYDLEPFNEEDWTQNHLGMGRLPRQHDRQLDAIPVQQAEHDLARLQNVIDQMVSRMPPHHVYLARFKAYLEKKSHV